MIEITGYIIESYRGRFTINITNDNVEDQNGNHPEVSKEVSIYISVRYPNDYHERFESAKNNEWQIKKIDLCRLRSSELKKGDRVKCCVFIVDTHKDNGVETYTINTNRNDIETYTKFDLWLYPDPESFKRLEVDTPETLKFRKQSYYTHRNSGKYQKITGTQYYGHKKLWWINKNPKIIFPMLWGLKVKTTFSNLWKRFTKQETPISIVWKGAAIISSIIAIWALFFKDNK